MYNRLNNMNYICFKYMYIEVWYRIYRLVSIIVFIVRFVFCDYNLFINNYYYIRFLSVFLFLVNDNVYIDFI